MSESIVEKIRSIMKKRQLEKKVSRCCFCKKEIDIENCTHVIWYDGRTDAYMCQACEQERHGNDPDDPSRYHNYDFDTKLAREEMSRRRSNELAWELHHENVELTRKKRKQMGLDDKEK